MNLKIRSSEKGAYYLESGTLVGSTALLNGGLQRFITFTAAPVHQAVRMASLNPANLLEVARMCSSTPTRATKRLYSGFSWKIIWFIACTPMPLAYFTPRSCNGWPSLLLSLCGGLL